LEVSPFDLPSDALAKKNVAKSARIPILNFLISKSSKIAKRFGAQSLIQSLKSNKTIQSLLYSRSIERPVVSSQTKNMILEHSAAGIDWIGKNFDAEIKQHWNL